MDFDNTIIQFNYNLTKAWLAQFRESSQAICTLASQFRKNDDCLVKSLHCGSFNISLRLHWEDDGPDWLIRFPIPGKSMLPDEKVRNEVAVMKFIQQNTRIPVPSVIACGMGNENPTGLGPFIIMTFVEGRKMSEILKGETRTKDDVDDVLDPHISESTLSILYGQVADILLQLFKHDFDHIGSLSMDGDKQSWSIKHRPLTLDMNETLRCSGLTQDCLPKKVYCSARDYLLALCDMQFARLARQRNSICDAEDCREKYTCRRLFQATMSRFICRKENSGPFKLNCDDLCPGNILVDESLQIVAVVDWEFCYAAPTQFVTSAPGWLLLRKPSDWLTTEGPRSFLKSYTPKLELFLKTMEEREEVRAKLPTGLPSGRLSTRMRQSFEDRTFWFNMAARTSFDVDDVYWYMLDEYCYGPRSSIKERVTEATSGVDTYKDLEHFVRLKINHLKEYNSQIGCEENVDGEVEGVKEGVNSASLKTKAWVQIVHKTTFSIVVLMLAAAYLVRRKIN